MLNRDQIRFATNRLFSVASLLGRGAIQAAAAIALLSFVLQDPSAITNTGSLLGMFLGASTILKNIFDKLGPEALGIILEKVAFRQTSDKEIQELLEKVSSLGEDILTKDAFHFVAHHQRTQLEKIEDTLFDMFAIVTEISQQYTRIINLFEEYERVRARNIPRQPFMVGQLPADFVHRHKEYNALVELLLGDRRQNSVAITTAIRGAGGYGKTTLAMAICTDNLIQMAYPDGILWVTLGESASGKLVALIEDCIFELTGERPGYSTQNLRGAQLHLAKALGNQKILLVIDDVWEKDDLAPFIEGGPSCIRLVTTRNRDTLLDFPVETIDVDAMQQDEAEELLSYGLSLEERTTHRVQLYKIAIRIGKWPLLLRLVNAVIRERMSYGTNCGKALEDVDRELTEYGLTAFDVENSEWRNRAVFATLEVSFQQLSTEERARFYELAVFPEDTNIPLTILEQYWAYTAAPNPINVKRLTSKLFRFSLLLDLDTTGHTIRLHDVIRTFLLDSQRPSNISLHRLLLESYRSREQTDKFKWYWTRTDNFENNHLTWLTIPYDEPYLWDRLAYHLVHAEEIDELIDTALDLRFLATKTYYRTAFLVERDLFTASQIPHSKSELVKQLYFHMARITDFIERVKPQLSPDYPIRDIALLIYSQIHHLGLFQPFLQQLVANLKHPHLLSLHRLPDLPHPGLLRTLTGHGLEVASCAYSPDGSRMVSASADGTLVIWNTENAQIVSHLSRETRIGLTCCAYSPNGDWIVGSYWDGSLVIWDAQIYRKKVVIHAHTDVAWHCDYSPNGKLILSVSTDDTIRLWDAENGSELRRIEANQQGLRGCAFSPDGRYFLSCGVDKSIKLWDLTGKELKVFLGHSGQVRDCAFSPNGKNFVSSCDDKTLRIWDVATGETVNVLMGHSRGVTSCNYNPDGSQIASTSYDKTVRIWNAASGIEVYNFEGHVQPVFDCAYHPHGHELASASRDKSVKVWNSYLYERRLILFGHTNKVKCSAYHPDGTKIVSGSYDTTLKLWDVRTGRHILDLVGHENRITDCDFRPDGALIVSASQDQRLILWEPTSGEIRGTFTEHSGQVLCCEFSPDGAEVVSGSDDGALIVWDVNTQSSRLVLKGHHRAINDCCFHSSGTEILSASDDGTIRVWRVKDGKELRYFKFDQPVKNFTLSPDSSMLAVRLQDFQTSIINYVTERELLTFPGFRFGATACIFNTDGTELALSSKNKSIVVLAPRTGERKFILQGHTDRVNSCIYSPNGQQLASTSDDQTIRLWDATQKWDVYLAHGSRVTGCAFSTDSKWAVSASMDKTLKVWDVRSGQENLTLTGHLEVVRGCAISPDNTLIVSACEDKTLNVWRADDAQRLLILAEHEAQVTDCCFSPDGMLIASASIDKTVRLWSATTGKSLLTLKGHAEAVKSCRFTPDGSFLISGSDDKTLKVWDTKTGNLLRTLSGTNAHMHNIWACCCHPLISQVASASDDKSIKLWDWEKGIEMATLTGHLDHVRGCAYAPNGRYLVSVSHDKTIKIWELAKLECVITLPVNGILDACAWANNGEYIIAAGSAGIYFLRFAA